MCVWEHVFTIKMNVVYKPVNPRLAMLEHDHRMAKFL